MWKKNTITLSVVIKMCSISKTGIAIFYFHSISNLGDSTGVTEWTELPRRKMYKRSTLHITLWEFSIVANALVPL